MPPPRPATGMSYGEHPVHAAPVRGRSLVVESSIQLLKAFLFFRYRNPAVLICWTMGQQAFNASMILILDAWETENQQNEWLVNQAYAVFHELQNKGVHKLAELAVRRISSGLMMLEQRRHQREQQAAASRRQSGYQHTLQIDTASMADFSNDAVMGNTGMFLLEDPGLQSYMPPSFQPLGWNMAGSAHPSNSSNPTTPNIPSPVVPVSQVTAAPFPVMSAPFTGGSMTTSSYPLASSGGFPARIPNLPPQAPAQHHHQQQRHASSSASRPQAAFTPINTGVPLVSPDRQHHHIQQSEQQQQHHQQQQSFSQVRGPRHSHSSHGQSRSGSSSSHHHGAGAGPRGIHHHRLDRPPKSQQRRKG